MAAPSQVSGMRAVYAVAAELSRLELTASVLARNAKGADILVTDVDCLRQPLSVQVKSRQESESNRARNWHWLVGKGAGFSKTLVFVFVYFPKKGEPEFFVVPSQRIQRMLQDSDRKMSYVRRIDVEAYQDDWEKALAPLF